MASNFVVVTYYRKSREIEVSVTSKIIICITHYDFYSLMTVQSQALVSLIA